MIVPDNEGIAVEAWLPSRDIGFVLAGQPVEIKVAAFPFTRYGTIAGKVAVVSGDSVEAGEGSQGGRRPFPAEDMPAGRDQWESMYSVRVVPAADHISRMGKRWR